MLRLRQYAITLMCVLFVFGTMLSVVEESEAKSVWVKGYYRKDGTYVRGHYRTAPDGNPYNNYSFPGNYNPNTGKVTTGDPDKYLERYYNKNPLSSPRNYSSPSIDEIVAPSQSSKSVASRSSVKSKTATNDLKSILAEIQSLRQELEALQKEVNRLSNKPVQTITSNKLVAPAIQGEMQVTFKGDFNGWDGRGSWIHLTNGQIWEQIGSGYKYFKSSTATIYKFSDGYKMWAEGCEKPIRVRRIK